MPLTEYSLILFTSFFTLINPLGAMPVFLGITRGLEPTTQRAVAIRAVGLGFLGLMLFALTGQMVFRIFSISADSLRVAGGILFFIMGYDMLRARLIDTERLPASAPPQSPLEIAVAPLAIPMLCGPGAITNAIVMWADAPTLLHRVAFVAVLGSLAGLSLLLLLGSSRILPRFGAAGNQVMMRVMGLIVMVIAVEFFLSGAAPIARRVLRIP